MTKNILFIFLFLLLITFAVSCRFITRNEVVDFETAENLEDEEKQLSKEKPLSKEKQLSKEKGTWEWEIASQEAQEEDALVKDIQKEFSYPIEKIKVEPHISEVPEGEKIDITFNFLNADIKEVLNVILGEILKINYTLDKRISGLITLRATGKFYRNELIDILQGMLNINGFALARNKNIFQVTPIQEARSDARVKSIGEKTDKQSKDVITQIVPMKYIAPQTIIPTLRGLLTKAGFVIAPNDTHAIIISEKISNIDKLMKIIETFDVPFFVGKALKFYEIKHTDAESLAKDLASVAQKLGAKSKGKQSDVSFIPFNDTNKILVITNTPEIFPSIDLWISNIDVHIDARKPKLYIYKMQHEQAETTANILIELFKEKTTSKATKSGKGKGKTLSPTGKSGVVVSDEPLKIIADKNTNTIIIRALPADYKEIKSIIEIIDATPQQVLIEAVIAEITLSEGMEYGVEYFFRHHGNNKKGATVSLTNTTFDSISGALSNGTNIFTLNRDIDAIFSLIAGEAEIEILSSPHILVRDEQTASIQVGSSEPIRTGSTTGSGGVTTDQIEYRDIGTILTVTPRIGENQMVTLDIKQEVSAIVPPSENPLIDSPAFSQRVTETSLVIKSGHTIYLGGIIGIKNDFSIKKIPLLGDIPFLGYLFKSIASNKSKTELMVLITPHIINTASDSDTMTREFKDKLKEVAMMTDNY